MADAEATTAPASVLDASALIALLHDEPGARVVVEAIAAGAAVSAFNWAEVLSKVAVDGDDPRAVATRLAVSGAGEAAIWVEAPSAEDCISIAELRPLTKPQGLSLADRACLALAARGAGPERGRQLGRGGRGRRGAADPAERWMTARAWASCEAHRCLPGSGSIFASASWWAAAWGWQPCS